ncbi:hypothetical protein FRC10_011932, partial [Ceratobasidium sp. 414]
MAAPAELKTRQTSCSALQLVFLAGTGESGLGLAGGPLSTSLKSAVSGTTTYSVPYDTSDEYSTTIKAGATLTANYLATQAARCLNQLYALGEYLKGVMEALLRRMWHRSVMLVTCSALAGLTSLPILLTVLMG